MSHEQKHVECPPKFDDGVKPSALYSKCVESRILTTRLPPNSYKIAMATLIKVFVQRDGAPDFTYVNIDKDNDVATAKEIIVAKLGVTDPADQVTLWTVDGAGALIKLDGRRSVDCQLVAGSTVKVKVEPLGMASGR